MEGWPAVRPHPPAGTRRACPGLGRPDSEPARGHHPGTGRAAGPAAVAQGVPARGAGAAAVMTDAQLADFLGLEDEPPEAVARLIATMDPKTRAAYERMAEV